MTAAAQGNRASLGQRALVVECKFCAAQIGAPCVTRSGNVAQSAHGVRVRSALARIHAKNHDPKSPAQLRAEQAAARVEELLARTVDSWCAGGDQSATLLARALWQEARAPLTDVRTRRSVPR